MRKGSWYDGFGPLVGVAFGSFLFWCLYAVFIRRDIACGPNESFQICSREWLAIILPVIGIALSAIYVTRQIALSRTHFMPAAVEHLRDVNVNIRRVLDALATMSQTAKLMVEHKNESGRNLWTYIDGEIDKFDVDGFRDAVARCQLDDPIYSDLYALVTPWMRLGVAFKKATVFSAGLSPDQIPITHLEIDREAETLEELVDRAMHPIREMLWASKRRLSEARRRVEREVDGG